MKRLWRSPTLWSVVVYGTSGVGFAGANLLLARELSTPEYALFTLVLALINLAFAAAPAGIDALVTRRGLPAGPRLLRRLLVPAILVAAIVASAGHVAYRLSDPILLLLTLSTLGGAAMAVAGARLQSEQRFGLALALTQSPNLVLLVAAIAVVAMGITAARLPLTIATAGYVAAALAGWGLLSRDREFGHGEPSIFPWGEALALAGLDGSGLLLVQLDRLVIPKVLPLTELATYGVLAAIVGSLFRVLQMGVGYTLIPRLRVAGDVAARRRLIRHEAQLVLGLLTVGAATIWAATPLLERWLLHGKYHLTGSLILAAIVSGMAKVANAFAKSMVAALAEPREVTTVNILGWLAALVAVVAAVLGARWGLAGVIYGVGLGWLLRAVVAIRVSARHLRLPGNVSATTT